MNIGTSARRLPADYLDLIRRLPLFPITSQAQLREAFKIIDELAMKGTVPGGLSYGEEAYLDVLSDLVEKYERVNNVMPLDDVTPRQVLKHLLEANDLSASDLGRLLGNRTLGSKILSGQRALSKRHVRVLADRFGVSTDLFL
jgi:HTH-type transcriptional regulator / antitoxin HigA